MLRERPGEEIWARFLHREFTILLIVPFALLSCFDRRVLRRLGLIIDSCECSTPKPRQRQTWNGTRACLGSTVRGEGWRVRGEGVKGDQVSRRNTGDAAMTRMVSTRKRSKETNWVVCWARDKLHRERAKRKVGNGRRQLTMVLRIVVAAIAENESGGKQTKKKRGGGASKREEQTVADDFFLLSFVLRFG